MGIAQVHSDPLEGERIADLMRLVPAGLTTALDVGARDGHVSIELAQLIQSVTALDLSAPRIDHPRVTPISGDARRLQFEDGSFDIVLCSEVLEHLLSPGLEMACSELQRVSGQYLLVGVPYRQDIRLGRTTCANCGHKNPPWGHVNSFDECRLLALFSGMSVAATTFVGAHTERTNALSTLLYDWGGNPWGTYNQEEPCVKCGQRVGDPPRGSFLQRVSSRVAYEINSVQMRAGKPVPNWIHMLFVKIDVRRR